MTEAQFIEMYGETLFADFNAFMRGQTVMILPSGETYFYKHDIENFFRANSDRFFD